MAGRASIPVEKPSSEAQVMASWHEAEFDQVDHLMFDAGRILGRERVYFAFATPTSFSRSM